MIIIVYLLYFIRFGLRKVRMAWKPNEKICACIPYIALLSIYELCSNVKYIYLVSCLVEIKL